MPCADPKALADDIEDVIDHCDGFYLSGKAARVVIAALRAQTPASAVEGEGAVEALAKALDYFRPSDMSRESASIVLTAGKMREHLAVIEAALRATGSGSGTEAAGWRPADTAPVNRAIQVYVPGLDYYGNEGVYAGMLVDMGTGKRWMTFAWAMGRDMNDEVLPTLWRDLPLPPEPLALPATAHREQADG